MLKTGIVSSAYFGIDNYKSGLKTMKLHGYDCADFQGFIPKNSEFYSLSDSAFKDYFNDLYTCAKDTGIEFSQMHGLWPHDDTTKESRAAEIKRFIKGIRAAGILRCKHFVIHPAMPYGWGKEKSIEGAYNITLERLTTLLPIAKDTGVTLCVENMPFEKGHSFSSVNDIKRLIDDIGDSNVKACFDTGHCNVTGEGVYSAIKLLGSDLVCLHVHDDRNRQDRHLIPYQGDIEWDGFIKGLKEIVYKGCISLETSIKIRTPEPSLTQMRIALANIAKDFAMKIDD